MVLVREKQKVRLRRFEPYGYRYGHIFCGLSDKMPPNRLNFDRPEYYRLIGINVSESRERCFRNITQNEKAIISVEYFCHLSLASISTWVSYL